MNHSPYKHLAHKSMGKSAGGLDIWQYQLTTGPKNFLLIGGVHGDEPEGYYLVEKFMESSLWQALQGKLSLHVIPRLNPDGCSKGERRNANGVDLNRNMPSKDWTPIAAKERYFPGPAAGSEPETKLLISTIESIKPCAILSAHSWEPMVNFNGPAEALAKCIAQFNGYKITDDIGYPTPGSLGTWAGWERSIPTITLEIERGLSEDKVWSTHSTALQNALLFAANNQ